MVLLRPATIADIGQLVALEQKCFEYYLLDHKKFSYFITSGNCDLILAAEVADIYAYALVLYRATSKIARLYSIAVSELARQQNLGSKLLSEMEKRAGERGCSSLKLEVNHTNSRAINFYLKHGYIQQHEILNYYPDGSAAQVFSKSLSLKQQN